jgi:hypothetical protein
VTSGQDVATFEALAATRMPWHYGWSRVSPFRWGRVVLLLRVQEQASLELELAQLLGTRVSRSKTRLKLDSWPPDSK